MGPADRQEALIRTFGVVNAYSEEDALFYIAPDRLGFGFIGGLAPGFDQSTFDALNGLLNLNMPAGTVVQWVLYANPDIEETIYAFTAMRDGQKDSLLKRIADKRVEFMREMTQQPMGRVSGAKLRNMTVAVTVTFKHGPNPPQAEDLREYRELRMAFISGLNAVGLPLDTMTAEKYIRLMEAILNHGKGAQWRKSAWGHHDQGALICNQLLDWDVDINVSEKQLKLGEGAYVRTLSVKRYPEYLYPGQAMRYMADLMKGQKAQREPTLITVNMIYADHESKRGDLQRKLAWAQRNAEGPMARFIRDWGLQRDSYQTLMNRVDEGDRIIYAYIGAAVFAESEDKVVLASQDMQSMFREIGYQMLEDRFFVHPLFSQLLPFAAEEEIRSGIMRYRTMATKHVMPMLPIFGSWSGTKNPLITLFARDGNLMRFSLWDSSSNYNAIVAAMSGAGKSFLSNELMTGVLSVSGRVFVIDKGYSYQKLCESLGGTYIEFKEDLDICLNPFGTVKSFEDEGDILCAIFEVMATPKEGLDNFQTAALKRAVKEVWDEKGSNAETDDVANQLLAMEDQRAKDVGAQMYAFTTKGVYGRWFNGRNNCDFENRMVVLELQQLSGRKDLQRVVLLQLMYQIQRAMDTLPREMKKLLLIDEAFGLLASNETKEFIVTFYRQLRKFGASCVVCTQSVMDLATSGAEAIVENSAHMLLLAQKAESISMVKKTGAMPMTDVAFKLLESVHTVPGEYSEIMVRNAEGVGVGRLVVSDFNKLLYSSRAQDVAAIKVWTDRGLNISDAINNVLLERTGKRDEQMAQNSEVA